MIIPGNGRQCKFWSTPWSPFGQLITFLGNTGPRAIGIPLSTSLGSLWNGESWTLPPARSNRMKLIMAFLITISLTHTPDAAIWNTTDYDPVQNQKFSARKVYNLIRESKPIVPWKNTVWLKKAGASKQMKPVSYAIKSQNLVIISTSAVTTLFQFGVIGIFTGKSTVPLLLLFPLYPLSSRTEFHHCVKTTGVSPAPPCNCGCLQAEIACDH
ncbi:hypothetical protein DY000_02046363 [Brassica cretica]|uniref:Uncharacterized protein n=1 Tax=Brassica cretica TaxID=69181 RepID=A0ABQ7F4A0_BRACR|nr:hypothetical protein DY000_02046363 [Brassica cretica]